MPKILVDLSLASRLVLTLCYLCMSLLAYSLMLLVMTFNYPILLMLCLGMASGHLVFAIVGLPELDSRYRQVAGTGSYMPEADNCCTKVETMCGEACPSTKKRQ